MKVNYDIDCSLKLGETWKDNFQGTTIFGVKHAPMVILKELF